MRACVAVNWSNSCLSEESAFVAPRETASYDHGGARTGRFALICGSILEVQSLEGPVRAPQSVCQKLAHLLVLSLPARRRLGEHGCHLRRKRWRRRSRPPRLGLAHRYAAAFVDLHHEATGVSAAGEPPHTSRAAEDDRVRVSPRLDREALCKLLFKEAVEPGLPHARRVDLAGHRHQVWTRRQLRKRAGPTVCPASRSGERSRDAPTHAPQSHPQLIVAPSRCPFAKQIEPQVEDRACEHGQPPPLALEHGSSVGSSREQQAGTGSRPERHRLTETGRSRGRAGPEVRQPPAPDTTKGPCGAPRARRLPCTPGGGTSYLVAAAPILRPRGLR